MTQQEIDAQQWAVALGKILALESSRGYDDAAVIGGLDRFRQRWRAEMSSVAAGSTESAFLLEQGYAALSTEQREAWARQWLSLLPTSAIAPVASGESRRRPDAGRRNDRQSLPPKYAHRHPPPVGRNLPRPRPALRCSPDSQPSTTPSPS